jgi:hypothetical protein
MHAGKICFLFKRLDGDTSFVVPADHHSLETRHNFTRGNFLVTLVYRS